MDKFHVLYNEMGCNFMEGANPSREQFKAALDAYIDERIGLMKPVEGKNAAVSTEGAFFSPSKITSAFYFDPTPSAFSVADIERISFELRTYTGVCRKCGACGDQYKHGHRCGEAKTVPLPVVGRCKDCKHWKALDAFNGGKCFKGYGMSDGGMYIQDTNSSRGFILVEPNFGCVHFEAKGGAQ